MQRYAIMDGNLVVNVTEAPADWEPGIGLTKRALGKDEQLVGIGYVDDGAWIAPVLPELVVSLGQLIDVSLRLGKLDLDAIDKLLPEIDAKSAQLKDGAYVLPAEKLDIVVADAVASGDVAAIEAQLVAAEVVIEAVKEP